MARRCIPLGVAILAASRCYVVAAQILNDHPMAFPFGSGARVDGFATSQAMAPTPYNTTIKIKARDGTMLNTYLWLPSASPSAKIPAIMERTSVTPQLIVGQKSSCSAESLIFFTALFVCAGLTTRANSTALVRHGYRAGMLASGRTSEAGLARMETIPFGALVRQMLQTRLHGLWHSRGAMGRLLQWVGVQTVSRNMFKAWFRNPTSCRSSLWWQQANFIARFISRAHFESHSWSVGSIRLLSPTT
eukprot:m.25477 g.25477  ORF g.25477 m.25477 type:complete len:247 (-) comp6199_c0_seq2:1280-2020(-)